MTTGKNGAAEKPLTNGVLRIWEGMPGYCDAARSIASEELVDIPIGDQGVQNFRE
jgi:hypothetical protein